MTLIMGVKNPLKQLGRLSRVNEKDLKLQSSKDREFTFTQMFGESVVVATDSRFSSIDGSTVDDRGANLKAFKLNENLLIAFAGDVKIAESFISFVRKKIDESSLEVEDLGLELKNYYQSEKLCDKTGFIIVSREGSLIKLFSLLSFSDPYHSDNSEPFIMKEYGDDEICLIGNDVMSKKEKIKELVSEAFENWKNSGNGMNPLIVPQFMFSMCFNKIVKIIGGDTSVGGATQTWLVDKNVLTSMGIARFDSQDFSRPISHTYFNGNEWVDENYEVEEKVKTIVDEDDSLGNIELLII